MDKLVQNQVPMGNNSFCSTAKIRKISTPWKLLSFPQRRGFFFLFFVFWFFFLLIDHRSNNSWYSFRSRPLFGRSHRKSVFPTLWDATLQKLLDKLCCKFVGFSVWSPFKVDHINGFYRSYATLHFNFFCGCGGHMATSFFVGVVLIKLSDFLHIN